MHDFCKTGVIDPHNRVIFVGYDKVGMAYPYLLPLANKLNDELFLTKLQAADLRSFGPHGTPYVALVQALREIQLQLPEKKFTVVLGKSFRPWTQKHEYYLPSNVTNVFACNVDFDSNISTPIPLGRDFRLASETYRSSTAEISEQYQNLATNKTIQCYANFSTDTFALREEVALACELNETITNEDMGSKHMQYTLQYGAYLHRLAASKFVICPRGIGVDSFRLWDSLYLGCIPVVTEDTLYKRMPFEMPIISLSVEHITKVDFFALEEQYSFFWEESFQQALANHLNCDTWRDYIYASTV